MKYKKSAPEEDFVRSARYNASLVERRRGNLLDIGAYKGLMKRFLPGTINYYGVDLDDHGLDYITSVNLNSGRLPFDDNFFDIIVAANVIEHFLLPPEVICNEIKRVTKNNARVIISLPNDRWIASLIIGSAGIMRFFKGVNSIDKQEFGHHWMFDLKTAKNLLSKHFKIYKIKFQNGLLLSKIPLIDRIKLFSSDLFFVGEVIK